MVVLLEKNMGFDSWFTWWFLLIYQGNPSISPKTPMVRARTGWGGNRAPDSPGSSALRPAACRLRAVSRPGGPGGQGGALGTECGRLSERGGGQRGRRAGEEVSNVGDGA